jgi:hypothetical protein
MQQITKNLKEDYKSGKQGSNYIFVARLRSLMDRMRDSGSLGRGSIPFGATFEALALQGFFVGLFFPAAKP